MLELNSFTARVFPSAEQALPEITVSFPGTVATDIRMPDMNGLQLFERIRAVDPGLPVILITGHGDIDLVVAALKDGAYDFITKPFVAERLTETSQACVCYARSAAGNFFPVSPSNLMSLRLTFDARS